MIAGPEVGGGRKVRTPMGNAPGNARGPVLEKGSESSTGNAATESATENRPPVKLGLLRQVFGKTGDTPRTVERTWQG